MKKLLIPFAVYWMSIGMDAAAEDHDASFPVIENPDTSLNALHTLKHEGEHCIVQYVNTEDPKISKARNKSLSEIKHPAVRDGKLNP